MDQVIRSYFFQLSNLKIDNINIFIDSIEVPEINNLLKKNINKKIQRTLKLIFMIILILIKNMILFI